MEKIICQQIDDLVDSIYLLDVKKVDQQFIALLDQLDKYISQRTDISWNEILLNIQEAYMHKNYVRLSDLLLYQLLPIVK
ncbi:MAG: hypothetical protein UDS45_05035 [Lachnospiraceae bacterium]|nr:hypothetical protein [Lachnospiraceae bacterium]